MRFTMFTVADSVIFIALRWLTAVLLAKYSLGSLSSREKPSSWMSLQQCLGFCQKDLENIALNQHHVARLIHSGSRSQVVVKRISRGIEGFRVIIGVGWWKSQTSQWVSEPAGHRITQSYWGLKSQRNNSDTRFPIYQYVFILWNDFAFLFQAISRVPAELDFFYFDINLRLWS